MNSKRRLFTYLLINILVSALVTASVIFFYDRAHPVICTPTLQNPAASLTGGGDIKVNIVGVIGAGSLKDERMIVQNDGSAALEMKDWYLTDDKGVIYTFPQLTLFPGVKMQLHTTAGLDSPTDLYWGLISPIWTSGELAALYDTQGIARAFYRIP